MQSLRLRRMPVQQGLSCIMSIAVGACLFILGDFGCFMQFFHKNSGEYHNYSAFMAPNITSTTHLTTEQFEVINNDDNVKYANSKDIKQAKGFFSSNTREFIRQLKWFNIILITTIHAIFCWGWFFYPWSESGKMLLLNYIFGWFSALGVIVGAHRLWTHRSYKAKLPLRIFLMLCYCTAGHNPIFNWVRDHRVHHKFTDTDADPHNSKRGFFFSHVGWLMMKKHPDVTRKGKEVDLSDILSDPVIKFHQKYYIPLVLSLGFIIPSIIPPLCWGQSWLWSILTPCVGRYVIILHVTWLVNSAAHMWGTKPFDKRISPTDNLTVALLTVGEGWHNYHHMFPWDYKASELGRYNVSLATFFIELFEKMGLAYDLRRASTELIRKAVEKTGDGTHPLWGDIEILDTTQEELFQCSLYNDDKKID